MGVPLVSGSTASRQPSHTVAKMCIRDSSITIDPDNRSEQILRETGILLVREGNNYISDGIYDGIVKSKCCKRAYLRGVFMGNGTMSDPEKAYHLEFVCHTEAFARDLRKLINSFVDLQAKEYKRGRCV